MLTRLAPTPSGFIHLGNILSFSITAVLAKRTGSDIFLRIDDLDQERIRREYILDIFQTLEIMGLSWQRGPRDDHHFQKEYSQIHRLPLYRDALERLLAKNMLYACDCSRQNIHLCQCRLRKLLFTSPGVQWRMTTDNVRMDPSLVDFVVQKKDGYPAYQLTSVVDDVFFGIDLVVRGSDLLPSTLAQRFLAQQLDFPKFKETLFYHHPLLMDANGEKLSKSKAAISLRTLIREGMDLEDAYTVIGKQCGLSVEVSSYIELGEAWLQQFPIFPERYLD